MRSILRLILILLTAVAVPIQGLAAAGMMHCAASTMPTHQHAGLSMGGDAQPHSHHGIAADTAADASADDLGAPAVLTLKAKASGQGHKCSACAACCAGVALPVCGIQLPLPERAIGPALPPAITAISYIASGLERPPRSHLA